MKEVFTPHLSGTSSQVYAVAMTAEELHRALKHCHAALGDSLVAIGDMLNQKGNPDEIITIIEDAQAKYNAISALLKDIES